MTMQDFHTHTTFSDGADSLDTMVSAAVRAGVTELGVCDHVRAGTDWLPGYVEALRRARHTAPLRLYVGVEAKVLDTHGNLDLPDDLDGIDYVAIADHRVPTPQGPVHPDTIAAKLRDGSLEAVEVIEMVTTAVATAALSSPVRPLIAHLFSILPKVGLGEEQIPPRLLASFSRRMAATGARVEINEKWRCPTRSVAHRLASDGVQIVAGSDSHSADQLGRYAYVWRIGGDLLADQRAA